MSRARLLLLTSLAMIAFAGNSLLCRFALHDAGMDAATFTAIRLASGALVLAILARGRRGAAAGRGNWWSALALFAYAAGFSLAYLDLSAATGALLLFGAVQATMIGYGFLRGERLSAIQGCGLLLACGGLTALLIPGLATPPLTASLLMLGAGAAWGIYSLRGRGAGDPTRVTAGNFLRAAPIAAAWLLFTLRDGASDAGAIAASDCAAAVASGALASGLGYALWYAALPSLHSAQAASLQLSVPLLAALGGIAFLGEPLTLRLIGSGAAVLGGIALVLTARLRPA